MAKRRSETAQPDSGDDILATLFEGLGEGVFLSGLDGKVTNAGASAEIITGRSRSDTVGGTLAAALGVTDPETVADLAGNLGEGWTQTICRGTRRDGAPLTLRLRSRVYRTGEGRPAGAVHLFSETSLQENLHRRLVAHQRLAGLGELSAALVHEVGNPVSVILGFAHLLMEQEGKDPDGEIRTRIYHEANRCRSIVDKLLDYARSSIRAPSPVTMSVREVASEVLALLSYRLKRSGIAVSVDISHGCPLVNADTGEMKQVLLNLLLNAIDASPQGATLELTGEPFEREFAVGGDSLLSPKSSTRRETWIRVTVSDRGAGLGGGDPERYFAPFYSTKEKGGGLGLAVCRRIAEQLGGSLALLEREGGGARAVMELPGARH